MIQQDFDAMLEWFYEKKIGPEKFNVQSESMSIRAMYPNLTTINCMLLGAVYGSRRIKTNFYSMIKVR